jgi:hypothetical protein
VHIRDNLRTLAGSAGQCTHKAVDVHIDPFCTITVTHIRDNLCTLTGSAGQCTHKPVDVHAH